MALGIRYKVLDSDAYYVHRAGNFLNGGGSLHADLGGLIGSASHLIRAGGNLSGGIARGANEILQTVRHADERIAKRVALRTRNNFYAQVAFGNGHGNTGHFLEIGDHIVERRGERADFVVAVNIDVLVEIAGVADFTSDGNQVR